jgi:phenylpropionate dioxygenase-like ring-hydroxylating dioxygenase large terminal subunit
MKLPYLTSAREDHHHHHPSRVDRHYFFNIPTHAPIIYTSKSTKFTLKHLKFAPTCYGPFLRPSSGGSWTVCYAVTKLRSVDVRSL